MMVAGCQVSGLVDGLECPLQIVRGSKDVETMSQTRGQLAQMLMQRWVISGCQLDDSLVALSRAIEIFNVAQPLETIPR